MEGKTELTSGAVTVSGAGNIPNDYRVAARTATPMNPAINVQGPSMAAFPPPVNPTVEVEGQDYSDDALLSRDSISAIPLPQEPDDASPFHCGRDFTPRIITVNAGEDVGMKIMSACTKCRAFTVLFANGSISLVVIRRPNALGGSVIYEGHFDIVSLNGSFVPKKDGSLMGKCGGLSVHLVDGEGNTIAGGLAGALIAESNVMVTVGSFLPNDSNHWKRKREKIEPSLGPSSTMGPPRNNKPITTLSL